MSSSFIPEINLGVKYISEEQIPANVNKNIVVKGFAGSSPTTGCAYLIQPPKEYQHIFQDFQRELRNSNLPIVHVRIPHATLIAAKVIDQSPSQSWKELENVQKVYRSFFLHHVHIEMESNGGDYLKAIDEVLKNQEAVMGNIAATTTEEDALNAIENKDLRKRVSKTCPSDEKYTNLKQVALKAINETSFSLKPIEIKFTNNGTIIVVFSNDDKLLALRLHLIVAGEGIAKWPKLTVMKNAWSTIGYTTRLLEKSEKETLDGIIETWKQKNYKALAEISVPFDVQHLGALAFRSNDFHSAKKAVFPLLKAKEKNSNKNTVEEKDLSFSSYINDGAITPIMERLHTPPYIQENWNRLINEEVV